MDALVGRLCSGALAGFAAVGPMTALMEAAGRLLPREEQEPLPPRQITERVAERVGAEDDMTEEQTAAATMAGHFGYGTGSGAGYGALAPHLPGPPVARGVAFALGLWTASYLGWLPAAGLYRPATRDSAGRNALMIAAHVLWGAILGRVEAELAGPREQDSSRGG
jgi:hypothetical protein